jgi:hypothetical protein
VIYFSGSQDRYYQYSPIRFFWPALSVFFFYLFEKHSSLWRSCLVSATAGIGTFWVIDTGVFIGLAFAGYLAVKCIVAFCLRENNLVQNQKKGSDFKFYSLALGLHLIISIGVFAGLLVILRIKAQHPLHLSWLLQYQKIFYSLGFTMLPLPQKVHPWMSILGIYLLGFIIGLASFYQNRKSLRAEIIFYLSLLGFGLFSYYEGRSHVTNLFKVFWPALLIMIITTDNTLHRIRNKSLELNEIWLPIAAVTFLLICNLKFMLTLPRMWQEVNYNFNTRHTIDWPISASEITFIKQFSEPNQQCLILSKRQAIYYAESGLVSPLNTPGLVETLLKPDLEQLLKPLYSGSIDCIFLGIGSESKPYISLDLEKLKKIYQVISINSEKTMLYLVSRQSV